MKLTYRSAVSLIVMGLLLATTVSFALARPFDDEAPMYRIFKTSSDIKALYKGGNAYAHIEALVGFGPRIAGGPNEKAAAEYIAAQMSGFGLDVETQEFPIIYFEDLGSTLGVVGGPVLSPKTMGFSPPGEFTTEIVDCGLGFPENFTSPVTGKIALIKRGAMTFYSKTQNAAAAGAVAAIIYNNVAGSLLGTLGSITNIPAVGITRDEGSLLLTLLGSGPVTVHLRVDTFAYDSTSQNVIGTLVGIDPDQGVAYIGAHYDSVSGCVGANDDSSGIGAMLEAARVLSTMGHRTKATIKFIAFGAEETGLDGSYDYVTTNYEEVTTKGIGMINLDMFSVGNDTLIGHIGISDSSLRNFTEQQATAMKMTWQQFTAGTTSDHTHFEYAGVPAVYVRQSPDLWYHTPEDTLDKINATALEANGELVTASLYHWAKNPVHLAKTSQQFQEIRAYNGQVLSKE